MSWLCLSTEALHRIGAELVCSRVITGQGASTSTFAAVPGTRCVAIEDAGRAPITIRSEPRCFAKSAMLFPEPHWQDKCANTNMSRDAQPLLKQKSAGSSSPYQRASHTRLVEPWTRFDKLLRRLLQKVHREQHLKTHKQRISSNQGQRLPIVLAGKRNQSGTESEGNSG